MSLTRGNCAGAMTKTVNLQEFHRMMAGTEAEDAQALPTGPSKCADAEPVKPRKWIAEWGGQTELEASTSPVDAPPNAAPMTVEAFKV